MNAEDTVPLMEPPVEQNPPDIVTHQPRATTGISTLSVIIKALLGETESHGCYCLFCPKQQESQQVASALLIGKHQGQTAQNRQSDNSRCYISSLKQHLTQINVQIFSCKPKDRGTQDELHQQISRFFSMSDPFLFILYYSGPTNKRGDWSITTTDAYGDKIEEYVRLDTIAKKWKAAKADSNSYLLIILDAEHSEIWREKVEKHETEANIIILASSESCDDGNPSGAHSLGQYTQSLIGSQGRGFFPSRAQEMIRKYLVKDPTSTSGLLCYVAKTFAYYKSP